jgi:hypothetical protein
MTTFSRVFTLEVDGRPVLAFEAVRLRDAQELCKEAWLHEDLRTLRSKGVPLMNGPSRLSVRTANCEEATIFSQAASTHGRPGEIMLGYLVILDEPRRRD